MIGRTQALPPVDYRFRTREEEGFEWLVREIDIYEELSGPFAAEIDLESDDEAADPAALLGASATLTLSRPTPDTLVRAWSGIVREVAEPGDLDLAGRRRCRILLEPALSSLKDERLTRKFLGLTVPQVARTLLEGVGETFGRDAELRLARESEPPASGRGFAVRDLCVQYDEASFDFMRRILAEEGITYFFRQDEDRETVVLVDENAGFDALEEPLALRPPGGWQVGRESLHGLSFLYARPAGRAEVRAFDLTRHQSVIEARERQAEGAGKAPPGGEVYLAQPDVTLFGYERDAYRRDDGGVQARLALERSGTAGTRGRGSGDVIGFRPGLVFEVEPDAAHPLPARVEGKYLLVSVRHRGGNPERLGGSAASALPYRNQFSFGPAEIPFRPTPLPKPTAIEDLGIVVSGIEGDPIDTDAHGRVRVRFGYDRDQPAPAEQCSPWIPVAQAWAGDGYGVQIIPRAGMVVRLRYLFGDPDRPMVVGCLPTGANRLPSPPPEEKARLTIRTRSLRDGGNDLRHFNEITLDDAAHHERVFIRAGHDYRRRVLHDEKVEVDHDERREVGHDQALEVRGSREKAVDGDESILVKNRRTAVVQGDDVRMVHGSDTLVVERDQSISVGGERSTTVGGLEYAELRAGREESVDGNDELHVTGRLSVVAGAEWRAVQGPTELVMKDRSARLRAGESITLEVDGACFELRADGSAALTCGTQIALRSGEASIVLLPDKVEISAPSVQLTGTNGALELDRTGATTTGLNVSSTATGTNQVSGAFVKAN